MAAVANQFHCTAQQIGARIGWNPTDAATQPPTGDRILLYTDGITEVFDSRGKMLGVAGDQEIVRRLTRLLAEEMKQGILDAVAAWRKPLLDQDLPASIGTEVTIVKTHLPVLLDAYDSG